MLLLLGFLSLTIISYAQSSSPFIPPSSSNILFEVIDSSIVEAQDEKKGSPFGIKVLRDSIFLVSNQGWLQALDLQGRLLQTVKLETSALSVGKQENLPFWTGNLAFSDKNWAAPYEILDYYIAPSYIYAVGSRFWAIFNKQGKLLAEGYWQAPQPRESICYTAQFPTIQPEEFITLEGNNYHLIPIERNWPKFWELGVKEKLYKYAHTLDYYNPENYLLALFKIPEIPKQEKLKYPIRFDGIEAEKLLIKIEKNWGTTKRRGPEIIRTRLAPNPAENRIYVALDSEHQVRVYDWQGNFLGNVGGKGVHLSPKDTIIPLPSRVAHSFDTLNFANAREVLGGNCDLFTSLRRASYRYHSLQIDTLKKLLFRTYVPPDERYLAHAKQVGIPPSAQPGCVPSKQYLQVIDIKNNGKVIYDAQLLKGNYQILNVNAPGDYWIFGYYMGDMTRAKLYRVKMTVKEE
jgi:hypothetical protein